MRCDAVRCGAIWRGMTGPLRNKRYLFVATLRFSAVAAAVLLQLINLRRTSIHPHVPVLCSFRDVLNALTWWF